jgi:hypothetical protein
MKQTYGGKIIDLLNKVEKLESVQYLYEYFIKIKTSRNCFDVELRRLVCIDLQKMGFNLTDISLILSKNHATIINLRKITSSDYVTKEVKENYKEWIEQGLYPISVRINEESYLHANGRKTSIIYKLVKIK